MPLFDTLQNLSRGVSSALRLDSSSSLPTAAEVNSSGNLKLNGWPWRKKEEQPQRPSRWLRAYPSQRTSLLPQRSIGSGSSSGAGSSSQHYQASTRGHYAPPFHHRLNRQASGAGSSSQHYQASLQGYNASPPRHRRASSGAGSSSQPYQASLQSYNASSASSRHRRASSAGSTSSAPMQAGDEELAPGHASPSSSLAPSPPQSSRQSYSPPHRRRLDTNEYKAAVANANSVNRLEERNRQFNLMLQPINSNGDLQVFLNAASQYGASTGTAGFGELQRLLQTGQRYDPRTHSVWVQQVLNTALGKDRWT